MGLRDVIANVVAIANTVTSDLQPEVSHRAYTGQDGNRKPRYGAAVVRNGLISYERKTVQDAHGRYVVSPAQITFLSNVEVDTRDEITLPDGRKPPIVKVKGFADPAIAGGQYVTEVYFGEAEGSSR